MSKKAEEGKIFSQHVFELRYKPYITFLDVRGKIAEILSDKMEMPKWAVGTNSIKFNTENQKERCFIGFNNLGYVLLKPESASHFKDRASKFLRTINTDLKDYFKLNPVVRLGVRSSFVIGYSGSFDSLLDKFKRKYISYDEEKFSFFKAKLIDAGAPYNFKSDIGFFNTLCGPMRKEEFNKFFDEDLIDDLPETGLFFDIDYFNKDVKSHFNDISELVKQYADKSYSYLENINKIHLG